MAPLYVPSAVLAFIGFATRATGFAMINGIGASRLSLVFGLVDGIAARIGLSLLLGVACGMGVRGFWMGNALAGNVIGVMVLIYYLTGAWKKRARL